MTDPELMLLDEPAAGLDLAGREDLVTRLAVLAESADAPALVVVTHHVEEIPPAFTHVLLLRAGAVVAAGPLEATLTPETLSATFGLPLALVHVRGRYAARVRPPRRARRPAAPA
jgi:iron complex transport system ATP-binding protein